MASGLTRMHQPGIRKATADDSEIVSELICELSAKYITHEFSAQGVEHLLASMNPGAIRKCFNADYQYHLAEMGDQVVGVVGVRDNSHLYHFFVAEKYQGRGIGRKLWQVAMDTCLSNGNAGEFTVNSSRYALGIYEKLGFVAQSAPKEKSGVVYIPMKFKESSCQEVK